MPCHPEKPKRRSDMACRRCRARKLKCENKDSVAPCKRCEGERAECIFVPVANDTKLPKAADSSRGSSEDCRSFNQRAASASPTNRGTTIQGMPPQSFETFSTSSACCRRPDINSPTSANLPLPTEEQTNTGFAGLHYRNEAFASVDGSPWLNPVQPEYSLHPIMAHAIMAPPHVNQGQPHPSARYSYSPPSDLSYSREAYTADPQPRLGIDTHSYHTSGDTLHESQNLQHQYHLPNGYYQRFQFQPNDLPANSVLHVGSEHNDNFYGHYR